MLNLGIPYINAIRTPDGIVTIHWKVSLNVSFVGRTLSFVVYKASESLGDWTALNEEPFSDGCVYQDYQTQMQGMVSDVWYRVEGTFSDGEVIKSHGVQLFASLSERGTLIARQMLMDFYRKLKKQGGVQGFLLKRKIWGEACPSCLEYDLENVVNAQCPICYGVGFVGGYHEGMEFWVMPELATPRARAPSPDGPQNPISFSAECAAYPWLDAYDVWVDAKTNERFVIQSATPIVEIERKPVVLKLVMDRMSWSDVMQKVPISTSVEEFLTQCEVTYQPNGPEPVGERFPDGASEEINSSTATTDNNWRKALRGEDY